MKMILGTIFLTMLGGAFGAFNEELHTRFLTMRSSEFLEHFNNQDYSWKMGQYHFNFSYTLMEPINMDYFSKNYDKTSLRSFETIEDLPDNFDSRKKWPHCHTIGEIYNQYSCMSCWAHGVANTASDRICIHTNKQVVLSEQDLECSHPDATICEQGSPWLGFQFWKNHGLVSRNCKPYRPDQLDRRQCSQKCVHETFINSYRQDKHYAEQIYYIPINPIAIKTELFSNGPVQAIIKVYQDFLDTRTGTGYRGGIYEHTHGKFQFNHAIRIIGYGVENGVEYLLAANSWGKVWGENGYMRIKLLQQDLFADYMHAGIPRKE